MSSKTRRTVIILVTFATLSLPLAVQARQDRNQDRQDRQESRTESFFALLWERLTAPFAAFQDSTSGTTLPPPPPAGSGDDTDGRSILDPIG
ncbi:MAG TPA: hypothetical protein VGK45_05320 [Thermoanaerobaculia bacterium]|jgi:hypothetical protein